MEEEDETRMKLIAAVSNPDSLLLYNYIFFLSSRSLRAMLFLAHSNRDIRKEKGKEKENKPKRKASKKERKKKEEMNRCE